MSIRIIRVKINLTQFKSWLNNEGYVSFDDEKYYYFPLKYFIILLQCSGSNPVSNSVFIN